MDYSSNNEISESESTNLNTQISTSNITSSNTYEDSKYNNPKYNIEKDEDSKIYIFKNRYGIRTFCIHISPIILH